MSFDDLTVTAKSPLPAGLDPHEYFSAAPYLWGREYRDGDRNPECMSEHFDRARVERFCAALVSHPEQRDRLLRQWYVDEATAMRPHMEHAQHNRATAGIIEARWVTFPFTLPLGTPIRLAMRPWVEQFLDWLEHSPKGQRAFAQKNNIGTWYDVSRLRLARFLGDKDRIASITASVLARAQAQIESDGRMPQEAGRADASHYTRFGVAAFEEAAALADCESASHRILQLIAPIYDWLESLEDTIKESGRRISSLAKTRLA